MTRGAVARIWHAGGVALANLFILNLLFVATSLAVVTIFPSVFAVFAVVREWAETGEQRVIQPYFAGLKRHFWRSYLLGLPIVVIGYLLFVEISVYGHRHGAMSLFMLALAVSVSFIFIISLIYLLPTVVSTSDSTLSTVEFAIFCGIRYIGATVLRVLPALFLMMFVTIWIPALLAFGMVPAMCWFVTVSSRPMRHRLAGAKSTRSLSGLETESQSQIGGQL